LKINAIILKFVQTFLKICYFYWEYYGGNWEWKRICSDFN